MTDVDDESRLWVLEVGEQVSAMVPHARRALIEGDHDSAVIRIAATFNTVAATQDGGERVATIAATALVLLTEQLDRSDVDECASLRSLLETAEREFAAYRAEVGDQCAVAVELAAERDEARAEVVRLGRANDGLKVIVAELTKRIHELDQDWIRTRVADWSPLPTLVHPAPVQDPARGASE